MDLKKSSLGCGGHGLDIVLLHDVYARLNFGEFRLCLAPYHNF